MLGIFDRAPSPEVGEIQRSIRRNKSRNVIVRVDRRGRQFSLLLASASFFGTDGDAIDIYAAPLPFREAWRETYGDDRFLASEISGVKYI